MKRILSVLLIIAMFCGALSVSCFATDLPVIDLSSVKVGEITISDKYAGSGRNVKITVAITGSAKVNSASISFANGSKTVSVPLSYNSSSSVYTGKFAVDGNTKLGTWQATNVTVNGKDYKISTSKTFKVITLGDVNFDGKVNSDDHLMVFKSTVGSITLSEIEKCAADVNQNGKVNVSDWFLFLFYRMGIIKSF